MYRVHFVPLNQDNKSIQFLFLLSAKFNAQMIISFSYRNCQLKKASRIFVMRLYIDRTAKTGNVQPFSDYIAIVFLRLPSLWICISLSIPYRLIVEAFIRSSLWPFCYAFELSRTFGYEIVSVKLIAVPFFFYLSLSNLHFGLCAATEYQFVCLAARYVRVCVRTMHMCACVPLYAGE